MNNKFALCTFLFNNGGFHEYENLQDMKHDQGNEITENLMGHFPPKCNVTYEELSLISEDYKWVVAIINDDGVMQYYQTGTTSELKRRLPDFINEAETEEYVTIYNQNDFVQYK